MFLQQEPNTENITTGEEEKNHIIMICLSCLIKTMILVCNPCLYSTKRLTIKKLNVRDERIRH